MMNLMQLGLKIHAAALHRAAGEFVEYRSGLKRGRVKAVVAESVFEESDGEAMIEVKTVDFLIEPSELERIGVTEPSRGDQITRKSGEVFDTCPGAKDSVWDWSDAANQTFYQIHTLRRKRESC
ncbi:hypothetical protein RMSM_03987 [Rhodopirellula maiorica SM1]|uniref:Phage head-tail joining protein domain-containing protein n=1 Tax=Rhodopirellula maiorica SM1 TaxID=1265738 RepID=M5RIR2_9BACT|nr:hypothetical protein [Rhodopirellula maiorica]EMI19091.1 hypothetical protein RMSM_03987 [Rhodopirellula maiorica SM1]